MASKLQEYRRMSEEAQRQLTGSLERWQSFLATASRLYKYPYHEQVMIHAQRPDATACAEFDVWNNTMRRYVRRGSKGIALIDTSGDRERLRYVFDVSDTGTRPNSRSLNLWELREEHIPAVSSMLEKNYGVPAGESLAVQLEAVASQLAREYWEDNRRDILGILEDSFLEEYDEFNVGVAFRNAAEVSISYSLMLRCGLEPENYFEHEDFMSVFDFNTPETAGALGTAVSGINQQVLREIGATIRNYEREQIAERSMAYENDVQAERGLSDPGHQTERAGGYTHREVRADAETVPEGASPDSVEPTGAVGAVVSAPSGDRRDGAPETGRADAADGEAGRRDGRTEAQGPAEMGGHDEYAEGAGRGDHSERAGVQLTADELEPPEELNNGYPAGTEFEQLSLNLFLSEQEQISQIDEADRTTEVLSAFSFAQTEIDDMLRFGSNTSHAREHIADAFQKQKPIEEIAALLQREFHGGYGIRGEHGDYAAWYDGDGIHLHKGREARYAADSQVITWEAAAERIGQMLEEGSFASNVELAEAGGRVRSELAQSLLYLKHDLSEEANRVGYFSSMDDLPAGYPDATAALAEKMEDNAFADTLRGEFLAFLNDYAENRGLLRFHYHRMDELWQGIRDISAERRVYPDGPADLAEPQGFITEDEISEALAGGSSVAGGKGRIYAFFTADHTIKEKADFLKQEYGIGGRSHALSGADHSSEDHSAKGIRLTKGGCAPVELNWTKVAERVDSLIRKDRYLTPKEQELYQQNLRRNSIYNTYNEVKHDHPDDMVLFQVGDFFELYGEDARQASELLDIRLTTRNIPGVGHVEMCGVPSHALDGYVEQLRAHFDVTISAASEDSKERSVYTLRAFAQEIDLSRYDVGYGAMGNGVTVWNRKETEHGDYKTIAHIDPDRTVKFYDDSLPDAIKEQIQRFADTSEMTISATQDASVFSVPPAGKEPVLEAEPAAVPKPVTADEISDALIRWNGSFESKSRVNDYMLAHGRERGAAVWLKDEFGGADIFSVVTDHGTLELPWAKVQRQLGILVNDGRFFTEADRMLAQAEQIAAQSEVEPYERFAVIETDEGYGIWDDLHDGLYVDEDGVTADFDSEWVAENYLLELKEKIAQREAAEWEYVERSKYEAQTEGNDAVDVPPGIASPEKAEPAEMESESHFQDDNDLIGAELTLDGRRFAVDDVRDGRASLRDITFQDGTGFPIFRNEPVETVRGILFPEKTTVPQVNLEAELTEAELALMRPQLDAAGIDYLVANAGYNRRTISFSSQHYREVQDMLDALPEELEQPRFTMELTSDAFEEPFIIRDNSVPEGRDGQYYDVGGIYQTFRSQQEAQKYADRLNGKEPFEQPQMTSETKAIYPGEQTGLPYDIVTERLRAEPEHTPPEPEVSPDDAINANPVSVQIGGEWQTFPNAGAAEQAMYEEYRAQTHRNAQNFRITDSDLGAGGAKTKYQANISAIRLLKQLEAEGLQASPDQQEVLSRYVGWGGLADAFDPEKENWRAEYAELKELLTPEEYEAARASTLNAHYTSPTVIHAIYEALENMGFESGNILEPSMGVGNFFGCLPESMQNSRLYGVELDSITGRIAKQLYPKADITVAGFETTDRRDFYDIAIGNVPFGQYQVNDRAYNRLGFSIHDYFFAKTLDQVRPGGVIAFVTSRYTMDKQSPEVRRYIAQRAELLGAIRLPNNAFKANAGTDVVSDIIFLQKRDCPIEIEPDWVHLGRNEDGFAINSYFVEHPEMILGRQSSESTQYGRQDFTVEPIEGLELADQLHDAVKYIRGTYQAAELPELGDDEALSGSIPADPNVKNYSYTVVDGEVYYRQNSLMSRPALNATASERVKGLVGLRDCLHHLIDLQMDAMTPDSAIRQAQAELNTLYDSFTSKYGLINSRANALAFQDDSSYYLLCTLEELDEEKQLKRKADIFTKRTIKPHEVVTSVDTPSEALALSISEKACVDLEYADDGYSGVNFERPGFKQMMEDIKAKKIDCVICKDLSRFARNYIDAGRYLEKIFPFMGVRFIAINDNYDSCGEKAQSDALIVPFKNLINDAYCRDISVKIRSQLDIKRKMGDFIGAFAPYGYRKDEANRNRLVVDEEAARTVELIFRLRIQGLCNSAIADRLNSMGILSPMEYKQAQGFNYSCGFRSNEQAQWSPMLVKRILSNEIYIGTLIQHKSGTPNHKIKKRVEYDRDEWIVIENNHEPIICRSDFDTVQNLMLRDVRTAPKQEKVHLFSGFVFCGDCKHTMVRKTVPSGGKKYRYLVCSTNKAGKGCSPHTFSEDKLKSIVLRVVNDHIELIAQVEQVLDYIASLPEQERRIINYDAQMTALENEIKRYQDLKINLYSDMADGVISREEYKEFHAGYDRRIADRQRQLGKLKDERSQAMENSSGNIEWIEQFKKYRHLTELDRECIVHLIEKILIYDGKRIEVCFRYRDELENALQYMQMIACMRRQRSAKAQRKTSDFGWNRLKSA